MGRVLTDSSPLPLHAGAAGFRCSIPNFACVERVEPRDQPAAVAMRNLSPPPPFRPSSSPLPSAARIPSRLGCSPCLGKRRTPHFQRDGKVRASVALMPFLRFLGTCHRSGACQWFIQVFLDCLSNQCSYLVVYLVSHLFPRLCQAQRNLFCTLEWLARRGAAAGQGMLQKLRTSHEQKYHPHFWVGVVIRWPNINLWQKRVLAIRKLL
jgi:hypothetical protein